MMKLNKKEAQIYIPDAIYENMALSRTTSLCIAAHQVNCFIERYIENFKTEITDRIAKFD
jgi:hypothetical protein